MDLSDFQPQLALDDARIAIDRSSRRIAVRVASWGEVHSGFGEKVRIPRKVNVDAAHVGSAELADGSRIRVATLPMDTIHAPTDLSAMHAASWYENTGKAIARVRYSVDDEGIRADGVLFDDIEDATVDRVLAAAASGDWRAAAAVKRYSDFEKVPADFVGSCIVNIPGYSDTFSQSAGKRLSLVASANTIFSIDDSSNPDHDEAPEGDDVKDKDALQAGGDEGEGCGEGCTGCGCGAKKTVTLSASALEALLGDDDEAKAAAREEAQTALVAGGFMQAPAQPTQLDRVERLLVAWAFGQDD